MTKTRIILTLGILALLATCLIVYFETKSPSVVELPMVTTEVEWSEGVATERYSARVDRVTVVFEQRDYTKYRLKTNDFVRTGELNTERGYGDDIDATVYVLNWQKPEGEQIRYVRLTAEPTHVYILDGNNEIIRGSKLTLESN